MEIELSEIQYGIYAECMNDPESVMYNIPLLAELDADVDIDRLVSALDRLQEIHPVFTFRFRTDGSGNVRQVSGDRIRTEILRLSDDEFCRMKGSLVRPFDLDGGPLSRFQIYVTPSASYLFVEIHHTIFDGTSMDVMSQCLSDLYGGREPEKERMSVEDIVVNERNISSDAKDKAWAFYDGLLADTDMDSVPLRDVYSDMPSEKRMTEGFTIDGGRLRSLRKSIGFSTTAFFTAVMGVTLARFNGADRAVFSTVHNGRCEDTADTVAMLVRTHPVMTDLSDSPSVSELLKRTYDSLSGCYSNTAVSFREICGRYSLNSDINFAYQGKILDYTLFKDHEINVDYLTNDRQIESSKLIVEVSNVDDDHYAVHIRYRSDHYSDGFVDSFCRAYIEAARSMLDCGQVSDISIFDDISGSMIESFDDTDTSDTPAPVMEMLSDMFSSHMDKDAIIFRDRHVTYGQLDDLSMRIASYIHSKGIGKGDFVSILMPRCEMMAVIAVGILRSGAAYQPLDPSYPKERLNFMVRDAGAKLVIADRSLMNMLDEYSGDVLYSEDIEALSGHDTDISVPGPDDQFIILYTSGTTGTPKGCILKHGNIASYLRWAVRTLEADDSMRYAAYASFGFDANILDTYTTLCSGGTLYIIPEEERLDLAGLERFFVSNGITHGMMTTQVGRQFVMYTGCRTLRHMSVGGEKLVPCRPPEWVKLHNLYGPTETTVSVTEFRVVDDTPLIPIGAPNTDVKLYVVGKNGQQMPVGALGELYIAGPQVSGGYLNRPERTGQAFIVNPFSDDPKYSRVYRTGDVVRWLPDGNIEYVGRNDGQVKVRGFRIELTEVEKVIREFDGIRDATVTAFDHPSGGKYVAAYIVSDKRIDIHALNEYIASVKPPYMVPAVTMQIDCIPLNVNGKVDRRRLPKPEMAFDNVTPPQNDMQRRIFDIVSELVGSKGFGIETDLGEAGINSITMIRLNVLLSNEFNVDMQIRDLKENNTVEKLGTCISSKKASESFEILPDYPLSKTQEGVFSETLAHPNSTLYNIPLLIHISKELDIDRLKDAVASAVNAHPQIKAVIFMNTDGDIRQKRDGSPFRADEIEIIEASLDDIRDGLAEPFDIVGGRLFRVRIIESDERYLFIDMHHIISDGTSTEILLRDITRAYSGETLEEERYTGFDAALIEYERRKGPEYGAAKEYYDALLGGCETDVLPRPCVYEEGKGAGSVTMDGCDIESIQEYCDSKGTTVNGYMCSAFGIVLSKFCNTDEPVFATIYNGRNDSRLNDTVSMLVKTLPVICRIDGAPQSYVRRISQQLSDSMGNDIFSFAEIANEHSFNSDILFVYQGDNFRFDTLCGKGAQLIPLPSGESKSRITMQVSVESGRLHYLCEYDRALYDDGLIGSLVRSYDNAVRSLLTAGSLSDVDITDDDQIGQIDGFNDTDRDINEDMTPMAMISKMMSEHADKDAVVFRDRSVTYGRLKELSVKIASYIKGKGLGRGDFISILSSRNEMMTVSAVGVMASGAAYQPLDPSYPKERLNFMVKDAGVRLVIAERSLLDKIDEYNGDILFIDEIPAITPSDVTFEPALKSDPFIILYTSGTTGTPKGCILENRNLTAFIDVETVKLEAGPEMRYAAYASFGFDANMLDTYVTLCNGGTLYVIPEDMRLDLAEVDSYFIDNGMTHSTMTTQVGRQFMSVTKCRTLRHFVVGGEKLVPFEPPRWVTFHNQYGPSECTVSITDFIVRDDRPLLPIGVPHPNVKLYVVDKGGHQMPVGAVGELYAAGPQVSRGYLNRPEKTEQVFIANPFSDDPKYSRAYRTGDIVRWLPDGNIDFVGRNDGQVKVRGFRIELTEVEKVIREFEGIRDATVVAFDSPSGGKYLAAYVVSDKTVDSDKVAEFIRSQKPPYMVPSAIVQIDRIPLTVNSKVDRRKLPEPHTVARAVGKLPVNDVERKLCDIYANVLGLETVYADDNFFNIGGTSISASKLLLQCMNSGLSLVYKNIFDNPTPEQLSRFLESSTGKREAVTNVTVNTRGALSHNIPAYLDGMRRDPLGDVLLIGSTGFLGIHVLVELIKRREGRIYCLIRDSRSQSADDRLRTMVMYYFGGIVDPSSLDDITVIKGDLTDKDLKERLADCRFDTMINCAAVVKHFAFDDSIERVNYHGVKNLIGVALDHGCRFIHVSTMSVAGESVDDSVPADVVLRENVLDIGQNLDNKYVNSKYRAENAILDAVEKDGLRGKIFRAGNLMSRESDGEFQINFNTNSFMRSLRSYRLIGCFPVDDMDAHAEFTPIDAAAEALVLLAGTPDEFTVFHGDNCHFVHMANIIESIRRNGMGIDIVSRSEFNERFTAMLSDEKINSEISGLLSYMGNDGENRRFIGSDNAFTVKALYRLGFSWPIVDNGYIDRVVRSLETLRFFGRR